MTETRMQRALRLARENVQYGGFGLKIGVCPLCGVSAMISKSTGAYCYNCHKQIDIDEVMDHDRR